MGLMIETETFWRFRTPGGHMAGFHIRAGTSDWNTVNACTEVGDEYGLPSGQAGWMLDVGAHIGSVIVTYLLDNPDARGIAIEALPENVDYIYRNLRENGVEDRAIVFHGAAEQFEGTTWIGYGDVRDPTGIHQYIGNANAPEGSSGFTADNVTLAGVLDVLTIDEIAWTKLDCEGCEYPFLSSPAVTKLKTIVGEVHFGNQRLIDILSPTHNIDAKLDFGPFWAYRKEDAA